MNLDQHGAVPKVEQPTKEDHILAKDSSKSRLKTQDQEIKWKQHSSILRHEVHQSRHNALRLEFVVLLPLANLPAPYSVCYQWPHFGRYSRKAATGWNDMPAAPSAHHRAWTKAYRSNKVLSKSIQKSYCSVTRLFQAVSSRFKLLSIYLIVPWGRYLQAMKLRSQFAQSAGQHRQLPFDKCSIHFKYSIVYSDIFRIFQNVCKWYKTNACNIL